jgi:hypothetical protein
MTIGNLSSKQETKAMHQISTANDVRTIIASHERSVGTAQSPKPHDRA